MPYTIHEAILAALGFLTFEKLPEEEQPPRRIWLDGDKMAQHWEGVKADREAKYAGHEPMRKTGMMDKLKIVTP